MCSSQVNIANQIYIFIDKHINHLDNDLQELDAAIEAERKELGLEDEETACGKLNLKVQFLAVLGCCNWTTLQQPSRNFVYSPQSAVLSAG